MAPATPAAARPRFPRWIAHRGAGRLAPENTLAAFRLGAAYGYRAFECDVKISADEVAFLLHDATLERTTNGSGIAGDQPWSDLSRLDAGSWHGRRDAGEPLASLASIARYCIVNGFDLNIEIKPTPGREEPTGRLVALAARQLWKECRRQPLLSSFAPAALAAAQAAAPELPRALLIDKLETDWLGEADRLDCHAVVAHHPLIEQTMAASLQRVNRQLLAYTVNDEQVAARLLSLGVDGLITDAIDRFPPAMDEP